MILSSLKIVILIGVSLPLMLFPRHSQCSYVIDSHIQKNYTDYCAKTEYCPEGTHVMCMYKHYFKFHGRCGNMRELDVNATLATWLMNVSNAIRRKIALGTEKVNGKPLPRGYGMFKLSWDPELATFAQTLADECLLQHDLCRGSKRFPHPGQIVGVCRFTYPDWQPIIGGTLTTSKRLNFVKIKYALKQILMSWYNQKKYATEDMIQRYPAEAAAPSPTARPYLDIISGKSTHMGCGISGYSQFAHYDYNTSLIYNHLQLVCNYSHRPLNGTPLYTTSPPTQAGYTVKCGCPEGYDEDSDCLCVANGQIPAAPPTPMSKFCSDNNCTPAVVLLPIFNVEDAPPEKLIPPSFLNQTRRIEQSFEIFDDHVINGEPESLKEFNDLFQKSGATNIRSPYNTRHAVIQRRTYGAPKPNQLRVGKSYSKIKLPAQKHIATQSIFSKAAKFQLPTKTNSNQVKPKEIIKDVAPRRDFANVQKLLQTYLNNKRNSIGNIFKGNENTYNGKPKFNVIFNHKTDNTLNTNKVVSTNFNKQKHYEANMTNNIIKSYVKSFNGEADKKFMALLDNLEQEVKHTDLDATEKEIFDTKIRKIYSAVVDKRQDQQFEPTPFKSPYKEVLENLINYENAADNEFIDEKTLNKRIHKSKTYDGFEDRTQDFIRNKNKNHRNILKTIYNVEDNFKETPTYRNEKGLQEVRKEDNIFGNPKYNDIRINNFNPKIEMNEDPLSYERKKYYQEKLDNLERKLQSIKVSRHRNVHPPRQVRPVLPTYQSQMEIRPSKASPQMDTFYIPDRARFIHGF